MGWEQLAPLTDKEQTALRQFLHDERNKAEVSVFSDMRRWVPRHLQVARQELAGINRLRPHLYAAKQKVKLAVLYGTRPHLDPDQWPKVWRKTGLVTGAERGKNQQWVRKNETAAAEKLNKLHVWTTKRQGDLIIEGRMHQIASGIGAAPIFRVTNEAVSNNPSDVSGQLQRMYGTNVDGTAVSEDDLAADRVEPFWVNCVSGRRITEEGGTVLLDPAKELVSLFAGALAGFAGGALPGNISGPASQIMDSIRTGRDAVELGTSFAEPGIEKIAAKLRDLRLHSEGHVAVCRRLRIAPGSM
jgi:hypothetical protein